MRFVTRNLHQGGPKDFSALRKTLSSLQPDVLFVQECCDPQRYKEWTDYNAYWACVGHGRWGSAILVREGVHYEPMELALPAFAGWAIAGKLLTAGREIPVVNVHMHTDDRSYSLMALEALAALGPIVRQGSTILGGDWNLTITAPPGFSAAVNLKGSRVVREQLAKMQLTNAWQHANPDDVPARTLRYQFRLDSQPHHIDGFLITPDLVPRLRSCEVLETEEWLDSDHNPVVMELDI